MLQGGSVTVVTTQGKGHSTEYLAKLCAERIVYVSKDAPAPIRDQALAFQDTVNATVLTFMQRMAQSERTTMIARLEAAGHFDAAGIIRSL
jgi:hypothetical protein